MVVLLTPNAMDSGWLLHEIEYTLRAKNYSNRVKRDSSTLRLRQRRLDGHIVTCCFGTVRSTTCLVQGRRLGRLRLGWEPGTVMRPHVGLISYIRDAPDRP